MANRKLSDGVGKKIVEALKKQSEIEVNPSPKNKSDEDLEALTNELSDAFNNQTPDIENAFQEEEFSVEEAPEQDNYFENIKTDESENFMQKENPLMDESTIKPASQPASQSFASYQQPTPAIHDSFISELDTFEIPTNIAVLKKLITQLPSGVTRHTGAQIIKQTMEALGISMKSVLQEAQQVQDGLNSSGKECYSTIQEYKKQIMQLEKQAQNYQKQYSALNELISLFIQTGV